MELIHNDSMGMYFEADYQEALQLVYLGILSRTCLNRYNNISGVLTLYIPAKDPEKEAVKLRIKNHFEKLEET